MPVISGSYSALRQVNLTIHWYAFILLEGLVSSTVKDKIINHHQQHQLKKKQSKNPLGTRGSDNRLLLRGGGGAGGEGAPLYGYVRPQRVWFSAVLVINRLSILAILVRNRVWFCTLVLN